MTPFQPCHCSCAHDNHPTLQPERGNYAEGCSSRSVKKKKKEEKREIRTGEPRLYCLLREVVKQRAPITAGCRMKDVMRRYEEETLLDFAFSACFFGLLCRIKITSSDG